MVTEHSRRRDMVGPSSHHVAAKRRTSLTGLTVDLIGAGYKLGTMDCFTLIVEYLRRRGLSPPDKFKGYSMETYAELYQKEPKFAKELMVSYVDQFLERIPATAHSVPGDIVLVRLRGRTEAIVLAIDGGNGHLVLATEERGVTVIPSRYYTKLRSWKCLPR